MEITSQFHYFCAMPEVKFEAVAKALKGRDIKPLYFFFGAEPYFINQLGELAEQHVLQPGEEAFNKTVFYGKDSDAATIVDQVRRFPMMAERQLVMLKEAQALNGFDKLKTIFEKPVPTTTFVVLFQKDRIDKRQSVFKQVMANAQVVESKPLYENQIKTWLGGYLKEKKISLSPRAISLLLEYLGTELEKLANAIDKLVITAEGKDITDAMVEDTIGVSRQYNVFELQEAMGERNPVKIMKIAEVMESDMKRNPLPMVIPSLFNYFTKLYAIKPVGTDMGQLKKILRIRSDFIIKKYVSAAKRYQRQELESMIHTLRDFDLKSKGVHVRDLPAEALFKEMVLRLVHGV